jgi:hypothetical protein
MYDGMTPFYPSPRLMAQFCSFHLGKVETVADPEGRGRVKISVPGLLGKGKKNWTNWVEKGGGPPIGGTDAEGDQGFWCSLQKGQAVMVGFVSGHPDVLWLVPGMPCQKGKGKSKQYIPREAKKAGKDNPRDATRLEIWKDTAGNTILMDCRGKKEKFALMDWMGAGLFFTSPGRDEDEEDQEGEEDKPRKGKRRGMKNVANGTAEQPSKICRDDFHLMSLLGLMAQGTIQTASDDYGLWAAFVRTKDGKIGPSVFINGKQNRIYLTAGEAQLQVRGDKGDIVVTRQEIREIPEKTKVEDVIEELLKIQAKEFEEFKEEDSGGGSGGEGGGSGTKA